MITERDGFRHLGRVALPYLAATAVYTLGVFQLEEIFGDRIYGVAGQLGSVMGLALAFFLGFRMNSAYDRWWEGRKIFGELTNTTRSLAMKAAALYGAPGEGSPARRRAGAGIIDLACWYVRQLRQEMHGSTHPPLSEAESALAQRHGIRPEHKRTHEILLALACHIEATFPGGDIDKADLLAHLTRFHDIQGKAERIRNTPFLPIYAAFTRIMVIVYVLLLPLFAGDIDLGGEHSSVELLAVPILAVVSTAFLTINALANLFGEPFSERRTSVPIDTICEGIVAACTEMRTRLTSAPPTDTDSQSTRSSSTGKASRAAATIA